MAGCTYSRQEPGLFAHRSPAPSSSASAGDTEKLPEPTNRQLPVLGEQIWTTGDGLAVTVRFAVHAVRRSAGATVLDWSVTPLASAQWRFGAAVPPTVDLGLSRADNGDQRIYLIDGAGRVYRPLSHSDPDVFHHCLCTPLWVAQLNLRIGETRVLQLVFPPLPADVGHVDVSFANSQPFWDIPVMAASTVPLAMRSVDLARPPDPAPALSTPRLLAGDPPFHRTIRLLDLQTGRSGTTLTWSVSSLEDASTVTLAVGGPPVTTAYADPQPPTVVRSLDVASGPELRPAGQSVLLRARWISTDVPAPASLECLCSQFGLWAGSLRTAGGRASVSTTYPRLPAGTRSVDVVLRGVGTIRDVAVRRPVIDPDRAVLGVGRWVPDTWMYATASPPGGWPTRAWPTPLPDPAQLNDYRARVDRLVDLPVG